MDIFKYVNKTSNTLVVGNYTLLPHGGYVSNVTVPELDKLDGIYVDKYLNGVSVQDSIEFNYQNPILPHESGTGIKLNVADPQFPWHDLLSPTIIYEGAQAHKPNFATLVGDIRKYQFAVDDESFHEFHIPHDYAPGTNLYIHVHWTHGEAVTSGAVTWTFDCTYAKGYSQGVFGTPTVLSVTQTANTTALTHQIAEVQLSVSGGAENRLNSSLIQPDGLILVRTTLSDNTTDADPFMMFCDVHYQSTNLGTKNRNYNFWS